MNFKHTHGTRIYSLNEIYAEDLQHKLTKILKLHDKINRELEQDLINNEARVRYQNQEYDNITYAFKGPTFKDLDEGMELFLKDFLPSLPLNCHVSFRQKVYIEEENGSKMLSFRLAVIPFIILDK